MRADINFDQASELKCSEMASELSRFSTSDQESKKWQNECERLSLNLEEKTKIIDQLEAEVVSLKDKTVQLLADQQNKESVEHDLTSKLEKCQAQFEQRISDLESELKVTRHDLEASEQVIVVIEVECSNVT